MQPERNGVLPAFQAFLAIALAHAGYHSLGHPVAGTIYHVTFEVVAQAFCGLQIYQVTFLELHDTAPTYKLSHTAWVVTGFAVKLGHSVSGHGAYI